jgi:hypothetical protein
MEEPDAIDYTFVDPSVEVGQWANLTRARRGRDEVTLDFLRRVPDDPRPVLVARVLVPPLVAVELRDELDEIWRDYTDLRDS